MHPIANIRGSASQHLAGKRIVLAVSGSIAAVKTVELARELARHGADVHAVMSGAATGIITPDALEFATGNPVVTKLTGKVEHVALLGDVPERADLLLVAPATANTVGKMALGLDDTTVTTCATVAFGTGVPVVVAPAMHDAMLHHPKVQEHVRTLQEDLDVTWVEPRVEEHKAKLADAEAIAEAVIWRLNRDNGPLAGKRCLVVGGATAERVDPVRILTNRSSGKSVVLIAQELSRLGAEVVLWYGNAKHPVPAALEPYTHHFHDHAELLAWAGMRGDTRIDQIWMPAAIADYVPIEAEHKIPSGQAEASIPLKPSAKIIEVLRDAAPGATLVAFKAESDPDQLIERARGRLQRYRAQFIVANLADAFGADETTVHLLGSDGTHETFTGLKRVVLPQVVAHVAAHAPNPDVTVKA